VIRVLVVDDDFRVADVHAAFVSAVDGMQVVGAAHTAQEALDKVESLRPDLVLLDNYLPDRSGLEVCASLASVAVDVIMVTADGSVETVRAALSAGALNFLVKPFTADQLGARLRAYGRYRSRLAQGILAQEQIDAAFAALHDGDRPAPPKGQSAVTAQLVREVLEGSDRSRSAAEVAEQLGISRATAQRYLSALVDEHRAVMRLRYGSTGRPEHEYTAV